MKNKFLEGTLILLSTSIFLRALGFVYQILIVRLAGTEAVGVLNMSMPFYLTLVILATAGMPVAIAKLTAEYVSRGRETNITAMMRTAFLLVGLLSCFCLAIALLFVPELLTALHLEARIAKCFAVLIPGIVIVPFSSVMRGYFQGMQQMLYPSLGQAAEQLIRVASGICMILWLCPRDVTALAMTLAAAAMLGELAGLFLLWFFYLKKRHQQKQRTTDTDISARKMFHELVSLGFPTTCTRLTSSIDMAIEASLVPACLLAVGYNASQAAGVYGQFSGVAISLITIPTVLTGALATALIPAVSEADAARDWQGLQQRCSQSIAITWMCSFPVILLLYVYGEQLCQMLFQIEGLGPMIRMLSFGAFFLYLGQTIVGMLQGLGQTKTVFVNNLLGSAAKLAGMYYCIRTLNWGSMGIAGGMVLGYGLQCLLNLTALSCKVPIHLSWKEIVLPAFGGMGMIAFVTSMHTKGHEQPVVLLLSMMLGGMLYLLFLFFTNRKRVQESKK